MKVVTLELQVRGEPNLVAQARRDLERREGRVIQLPRRPRERPAAKRREQPVLAAKRSCLQVLDGQSARGDDRRYEREANSDAIAVIRRAARNEPRRLTLIGAK